MPPLVFSDEVENALRKEASEQLHSTWSWMKGILTTLEEQLNMGEDFDTKVCTKIEKPPESLEPLFG